jgi:hypothetical protein
MSKIVLAPTPPTQTIAEAIADITSRAAACQKAYDDYAPGCSRRSTHDNLYEVKRNLGAVQRWLSGENDEPIVFLQVCATQEGRDIYRLHYAADSLVAALHFILGAEYAAGLRSLDLVSSLDPWRYVDGKTQGEAERLRLAEGITFRFPQTVLANQLRNARAKGEA